MSYVSPTLNRAAANPHERTVDIAGTPWPLYKLEALAAGLLVFLGALALTTTMQVAVLAGAAATVVVWWAVKTAELRSARETARTQ